MTSAFAGDSVHGAIQVVKADDIVNLLHSKQQRTMQEQKVDFEQVLERKLDLQLERYTECLRAHKAEIEMMLNGMLLSQSKLGPTKVQDMASPSPPTTKLESDQPEQEYDHQKEDAQLRQQYLDVCGWKTEKQSTLSELQTAVVPPSRESKSGDLKGFEASSCFQMGLANLVHSGAFQSVSAFLVISNSIMIAVQVDLDMKRAIEGKSSLPWERTSDICYTVAFSLELVLRIAAERRHFYKGPGRKWNMFDVVVVFTGVIDLLEFINFSLTYLRILRVLRVARVLRVIRVLKFFRELRMMALSIISCLTSLIWAFTLLLLVMFIFSMVLLEGARDYLRSDAVDPAVHREIKKHFGGCVYTLYTLLQAVSGGNSWGEVAEPFVAIHPFYGACFTFFIIFVLFGLLNVLIGVFVQNTEAIAGIDKEFVIQEEMMRKDSMINQMRELFHEIDADGSGTISWQELKSNLTDESMKAYFSLMQIETEEAKGLFQLLDVDESGEVAIEEFIMGCMRLKGAAKSIDLAALLYENKRLHHMLHRYMDTMTIKLSNIQTSVMQNR